MHSEEQSNHGKAPSLPCRAEYLVPQRPPMLLAGELRHRDREGNFSVVAARVPENGLFVDPDGHVQPEYFIELVAQSMAAVNGFDALTDGNDGRRGLLVGIDAFRWHGTALPGEELQVEICKTFEFGPVTVMTGRVLNRNGELLAEGEIKAWEQQ